MTEATEKSLQDSLEVGTIIQIGKENWRIIGTDFDNTALKKLWDIILRREDNKEVRCFLTDLETAMKNGHFSRPILSKAL